MLFELMSAFTYSLVNIRNLFTLGQEKNGRQGCFNKRVVGTESSPTVGPKRAPN